VGLARHTEGHVEEVLGVAEVVARIHERLAERVFVGHGRDRRHLGDQPVAGDQPLLRVVDVHAVVVEGGQGADHAAHDRHRVSVAVKVPLLVHHRVPADGVLEIRLLPSARQLAVQE
jgi:hypothetical protein